MNSYYQRYQQPHDSPWRWQQTAQRVWAELLAHGPAVRNAPLSDDARAVAQAMMQRARHNIDLIVHRLEALGYRFALPDQVWIPPNPAMQQELERIERDYGPLPLVLRAWFEVVGSVNLMGAHPALSSYADLDWDGSQAQDGDPLVVETELFTQLDIENYYDFYQLPIAPDVTFKSGESGLGSVSVLLPAPAFDAPLIDDGERWTGSFFVPYLRRCFQWGGFPGLHANGTVLGGRDVAASQAALAVLTADLLPL